MHKSERTERHVDALVSGALRTFAKEAAAASQPVLDGFTTSREDLRVTLTRYFIQALDDFSPTTESPAHFLARIGVGSTQWLHRASCGTDRKLRHTSSCKRDAHAIEHVVRGIALALFDLELHGRVDTLISGSANALDLTEVQRVDGLSAKLAEQLHPHRNRRALLEILEGKPICQFNSPIRGVRSGLYLRNRATVQDLAPVAEARGFRTDITSDYASPGHPAPGQEYLVRAGLLRAAADVFIMNGAGPGTGRAIELAASALTPILLLRRVAHDDPAPPNEDRQAGEVTGVSEMIFSTPAQARELVSGFLSSETPNIDARQRKLVALENGAVPEESRRIHAADESAFLGSRISLEEARFWADPVHFPFAGEARRSAIRQSLGMTPTSEASNVRSFNPAAEQRSKRALDAYARVKNLSFERAINLWESRHAYGPSHVRRDSPPSVEDWADADSRTPN